MTRLAILLSLAASPALAASGPFFSMRNTNFVVLLAFILFVGFLVYMGVPKMLAGLLDKRAAQIKAELDEARALREEAKAVLVSYERKQKEVAEQTDRIIATAKDEAMAAAEKAKAELTAAIARRLQAAGDQIASAEAAALRQVRERAVSVAVAAAGEVLAKQMTADAAKASIDDAIAEVSSLLH